MRVPAHFLPNDARDPWGVVERHGFATLVTAGADGAPVGSPLPFLGRPDEGAHGLLLGHMARANPQLECLRRPGARVLVIFQGPSAFISGSYYRQEPAVPTWNHVTVHVTGRASVLTEAGTMRVLEQTVAHFEQQIGSDWRLDVDEPYIQELARHVAAFSIAVERIEASFKLSQNVESELQRRVAAGLLAAGCDDVVAARAVAQPPSGAWSS